MEPEIAKNKAGQPETAPTGADKTSPDVKKAHDQADADIASDADLSIHSPNDDLDEGELARLGEDKTDVV